MENAWCFDIKVMFLLRHNLGVFFKKRLSKWLLRKVLHFFAQREWYLNVMFHRKNSSIKKWWILKKNLSLWFLEENVTFVVWKKVVLLTWLYVSKVMFWIWKQDFIFVWDKIFYHTSLMKMWHFYLLEKRDVLLQDCYINEGLILKEPFLFNLMRSRINKNGDILIKISWYF